MRVTEDMINSVNATASTNSIQSQMNVAENPAVTSKNIAMLLAGDIFHAEIADIKPNFVMLKLSDGSSLTARSLSLPDAHIGDEAVFMVKENVKGQVLLELVKPDEKGNLSAAGHSIIKEALAAAKMQYTPQNAAIVKELIHLNAPIDAKTIQHAAFYQYSSPEMSFDKIVFLIANDFPATQKTIDTFEAVLGGVTTLQGEKEEILRLIADLKEEPVKKRLTALVKEKFSVDIEKGGLKELNRFYNELSEAAKEIRATLKEKGVNAEVLERHAAKINESLDFMSHIGESKQYMQIPFVLQGRENQTELHVFNNSKKAKAGGAGNASALIAMDYLNLGHVEVYVNKQGNSVSLQFRADTGRVLGEINASSAKLHNMLREKGFSISGLGFKKIGEKFDLASGAVDDSGGSATAEKAAEHNLKRYSFDMRV